MDEVIEYRYTPEFVRKVYREYWFQKSAGWFVVATLGGLYLLYGLFGNNPVWEGVFVTLFVLYVVAIVYAERRVVKQAKTSPDRLVTVTFNDESITLADIDFTFRVKWQKLQSVTMLKNAWLFYIYSNGNYLAVPSDAISDSVRALIERKMAENHRSIK
jgi:hypothetical protein